MLVTVIGRKAETDTWWRTTADAVADDGGRGRRLSTDAEGTDKGAPRRRRR